MKTTRNIAFIALFTAVLCVLAPLSIPMVPVPISLGTLALYLIGALLDYKRAPICVILYILIGLIGVPVFAGYQAGYTVLVGPTAGFIFGYLPGVLAQSLLTTWKKDKFYMYPIAMILGTIFIYGFGVIWYFVSMLNKGKEITIVEALMACVVPFLIGDSIKIGVASVAAYKLRKFADKALLIPSREEKRIAEKE